MTSVSNQMITRCPKCGTAFRVTPSQLQSAKGAVRCGSCLHVFKAQDYLAATPVKNSTGPSTTNTTTTPKASVAATTPTPTKAQPAAKAATPPETPTRK